MSAIVHWFRRDLRMTDNTALAAAARDAEGVIPVFVLDDHYGDDPGIGPARFRFLRESLEELAGTLASAGGRLIVRPGPATRALPDLVKETGAAAVYANAEIGPYPEARDSAAADALRRIGAELRLFPDALLVEPDALLSGSGEPYTVYTPFARRWEEIEKLPPVAAPARLATPALRTVPIGRARAWRDLPAEALAPRGGESEAGRLLSGFCERSLASYDTERNRPGREGTSRLSPHLHFGTISPRTVRARVLESARSPREAGAFLRELAWRDFYHHVLFHSPRVATQSFRPEMDALAWRTDPAGLAAWRAGEAGYPLVDAAMRQLSTTHWMHNRARMVVASFLTKDLHVHWREGQAWFEHELADADLANNNGGWQWAAGSGSDAAPYFRIFHPVLQSKKFDPDGAYIRRFLPALANVPAEKLHEPWTMTSAEQGASGCRIGRDYPAPIVDHAVERLEALRMMKTLSVAR
ncbi:MAG: DNA photolyase family protein [Acidobacteriota bacterium]|nr:DNA photolyase family protein [Acidobacteriota bacterium]